MSRIQEIQERLRDTHAALVKLERSLQSLGDTPSLRMARDSLSARKDQLEAELLTVAKEQAVDVCGYRLFKTDETQPKMAAVTTALGDFQGLYSLVFDSISHGPKQRNRLSADSVAMTAFDFAYMFNGSLGVVMTLPDELVLMGENRLEETIQTIFNMVRATSPAEVLAFSQKLGPAPVRLLYKWTDDHVRAGCGVDIAWHRGNAKRLLLVQQEELKQLRETLASTSEEQVEEITLDGELVGVDVPRHTFHFVTTELDIRGTFETAITQKDTVEVPAFYKATILKTTRVRYSTEQEEVTYFLLHLDTHQQRLPPK